MSPPSNCSVISRLCDFSNTSASIPLGFSRIFPWTTLPSTIIDFIQIPGPSSVYLLLHSSGFSRFTLDFYLYYNRINFSYQPLYAQFIFSSISHSVIEHEILTDSKKKETIVYHICRIHFFIIRIK